jgi:hypothetical protein
MRGSYAWHFNLNLKSSKRLMAGAIKNGSHRLPFFIALLGLASRN